jgi:hypothetical protein
VRGLGCRGVFVGVFLQATCVAVGKVLYKIGVQFPHKLLDFQE